MARGRVNVCGVGIKINTSLDVDVHAHNPVSKGDLVNLIYNMTREFVAPSVLPAGNVVTQQGGVAWHPTLNEIAVLSDASPYVQIYRDFQKIANPAVLPPSDVRNCAYSPNGQLLVIANSNLSNSRVYKRGEDGSYTILASNVIPSLPGTSGLSKIAFSKSGKYLALACGTTLRLYTVNYTNDTFTLISNPTTVPASNVVSLTFGNYYNNSTYNEVINEVMICSVAASPFMHVWDINDATNIFTARANPSTLPSGYGPIAINSRNDIVINDSLSAVRRYELGTVNNTLHRNSNLFTNISGINQMYDVAPLEFCSQVFIIDGGILKSALINSTSASIYTMNVAGDVDPSYSFKIRPDQKHIAIIGGGTTGKLRFRSFMSAYKIDASLMKNSVISYTAGYGISLGNYSTGELGKFKLLWR